MRNPSQSLQSDLSGGAFYRVDRAKQFVDLFRIVISFQRNQAIADHLEMLLRFRLEELQDLVRHLFVLRQGIKVRARRRSDRGLIYVVPSQKLSWLRL